jgi:hypothetical protein
VKLFATALSEALPSAAAPGRTAIREDEFRAASGATAPPASESSLDNFLTGTIISADRSTS